jgi:hypothetical protein
MLAKGVCTLVGGGIGLFASPQYGRIMEDTRQLRQN